MQQTFRAKKSDLVLSLVSLAFCLPLLIAVPWMISEKTKPDNVWLGMLVLGILFGSITLSGLHAVLHNWRTLLKIDDEEITFRDILRLRTFKLSDVTHANWGRGTHLRLKTPSGRCTINLNDFDGEEVLAIASYFHHHLPENIQANWGKFCYRACGPKRRKDRSEIPTEGFALITRRRVDWLFLPALVVLIVLSIPIGVLYHVWTPLYFSFLLTVFWLLFRWRTPSKGIYERAITAKNGEAAFLISLFACLFMSLTAVILLRLNQNNPIVQQLIFGFALLSICLVLFFGVRMRLAEARRMSSEEEAAIAEWEKLSPPPV